MDYKVLALILLPVLVLGCVSQSAQPVATPLPTQPPPATATPLPELTGTVTTPSEVKEFTMTAKQWAFEPSTITVNKGDRVRLVVTSIDVAHGFGLPDFGVDARLEPGTATTVEFTASRAGTFTFFCSVVCGAGHSGMKGTLVVNG